VDITRFFEVLYEVLYRADVQLFYWGNTHAANPVFDVLMPIITTNAYTVPGIAVLLLWLLWQGKREDRVFVLILLCTILALDQCIVAIKEPIGRFRPCNTLSNVRLLVDCGTGKSFPSAHAANNVAFALLVAYFYPRCIGWAALWAILIAYSRVYCGVHYPSDIVGGAVIAFIAVIVVLIIWRLLFTRYIPLGLPPPATQIFRWINFDR
jgi:undecaprenyl-diphosphatase